MTKYEDEEHPYCKPPPTVVTEHQAQHQAKYQEHQAQLVDMKAEWSENFQDLSLFCNVGAANKMAATDSNTVNKNMMLQSGEQLDTPIITVNDEFDFGQRVTSRVSQQQQPLLLADASLDDTDPWADLQQHQPNNIPLPTTANNTKQWERVTDWLCSSPNHTIDYEPPTNSTFGDEDNFDDSAKLGLVGNNTGMEHDEKDAQTTHLGENLNPVLKQEQTIDIVELLKSSREPTQYIVNKVTVPVTNSNVNNSSRMQYSFAGKVVDSNRMQYTENKKEADTSSRMQYLLAGNKVTDISNSYLGNRSRVVTIPNMEYAVNKPTDTSNRLEYQFNKAMDTSNSSSRKVLRNSLLLKNSNSSKNSRDPLIGENTNNLSSMFKAEEPLVVQTVSPPLLPRGRGGKNLKKPQLTLHTPHTGEVIEIGSASPTVRPEMIFGEEYMLPVDIKPEPEEEEEVAEEEEFEEQPPVVVQAPQKPGKKLKLDIRTANTLAALGGMGLTPSTAVLAESLDTPDVLKPLLEGMDGPSFDLIKFCEADELAHIPSPLVVESRKTIPAAPKIAPSFGEKKVETTYERREPLSTIKEEDITTDESSSFHQLAARNSKTLPRKKIASTRKRRRTNFENYEVSENSSDNYLDNEDEDETFHLPPKTKYNQKSPSKRQRLSSKTLSIVSPAAKRKVSSSGIDSDQESIMSQDRYRELRDRNNEASKRSRMNRKSREMEMKEKANEMEKRNSYLKARAKRLDELVLTFREAIFKLVPKRL